MAGRGRGSGLTFNTDILGLPKGKGDYGLPTLVAPPPTYPPRPGGNVAASLREGPDDEYLLTVRKQLYTTMKTSQFYLRPKSDNKDNTSGHFADQYEETKSTSLDLEWHKFPLCLRPATKRKVGAEFKKPKIPAPKLKQVTDVNQRLAALEKAESESKNLEDNDDESMPKKDDDDDAETANARASEIPEEEFDEDEEMDEGTDYARDYFDNGEGYLDEDDDKLDEDGVY